MRAVRAFFFRLTGTLRKDRTEREMKEEMESHLQMQIDDNVAAGMTSEEARRAAVLKSGGLEVAREACRDRRGLAWVETAMQDLRHALQILRRSSALTAAAALSLALGVAATTVIFSVMKGVVLAPLPYPDPDRLVAVWQTPPEEIMRQPLTDPDYFDYRDRNRSFDELGVQALRPVNLSGEGSPERVPGSMCTASFLRAIGVMPAMGRLFTDREEAEGARLILLSHVIWQQRFGGDPGILGRRMMVNREPYTVVGVMPAGYQSPRVWKADASPEVWTPARLSREDSNRDSHWLAAVGRLKRGVSPRAAGEDIRAIAADLAKRYPQASGRVSAWVVPLKDLMVGEVRNPVWYLAGAVAALLLISCANVASIQFARGNARHAEVAIRASLGAGRPRVIRQFLTESLLLSGVSGAAGAALAVWGVAIIRGMLPATIERAADVRIDVWVLLFTACLILATGVLSGLAPALSAGRLDINRILREGHGALTAGRGRARFQNALVVAQFALALAIANGAVLMLQSYLNMVGSPTGFDAERALTAGITLEGSAYRGNAAAQVAFWDRLLEKVRTIPGVLDAGATTKLPLEGGTNGSYLVEDEIYDPKANRPLIERSWVTPEYFGSIGLKLVAGRLFARGSASNSRSEIVVNQAFVRRYFRDANALGKRVYSNTPGKDWAAVVVGVVGDTPQWGLEGPTMPEVYQPFESTVRANRYLIVRTALPPMTLARAVRRAVSEIDRDQPVALIRPMAMVFEQSAARRRFNTVLVEIFALLGAVMVTVGIYGVISCWVTERTREIGIRVALGANRARIIRMVVGRGAALALAGAGIGSAGSVVVSRLAKSLLFGVNSNSPAAILGAALPLVIIAVLASLAPALRAASSDAIRTLRAR